MREPRELAPLLARARAAPTYARCTADRDGTGACTQTIQMDRERARMIDLLDLPGPDPPGRLF